MGEHNPTKALFFGELNSAAFFTIHHCFFKTSNHTDLSAVWKLKRYLALWALRHKEAPPAIEKKKEFAMGSTLSWCTPLQGIQLSVCVCRCLVVQRPRRSVVHMRKAAVRFVSLSTRQSLTDAGYRPAYSLSRPTTKASSLRWRRLRVASASFGVLLRTHTSAFLWVPFGWVHATASRRARLQGAALPADGGTEDLEEDSAAAVGGDTVPGMEEEGDGRGMGTVGEAV